MIVHLVGAGPGDPELITWKGKRLLESADAVLYDALANPALLALVPAAAERCSVGKRSHQHSVPQQEIAAWMIERARRGLRVVRLKGGDPMTFARAGEEIEALERAGIGYEIVPGVSAAQGAAAATGIPLTLRGVAPGVRYVTGHAGVAAVGPRSGDTLVIYMGLERLEDIVAALLAQGWAESTAVAVVERATLPGQRVRTGSLARIAANVRRAAMQPPALIIVGEVVAWRRRLGRVLPVAAAVPPPGLVLLAHGSPLPGWQQQVEELARQVALPGQFYRVAYLPPAQPVLEQAVAAAAAAGVPRLVVVPYFLAAGLHVTRDLPELVAAARARWPEVGIAVSECLGGHPALHTAVLARVAEAGVRFDTTLASMPHPALCWGHASDAVAGRGAGIVAMRSGRLGRLGPAQQEALAHHHPRHGHGARSQGRAGAGRRRGAEAGRG
ncbi:MAG TPA: uroporphyrinogen-III C-methyltransferase [Terriglobales bacterium]|nr:uroporphyrinogen-III C-methyltransferase [Terriglobales bacterium]